MAEWPLIAREAELAHLTELLADTDARGVVLAGPAGVGKSRLGQECLRLAARRGMAVERITATYATSSLPLGAVLLSRPAQNAIAVSPVEQTELVHRVAGELVRQANGRRLALLVDDVNWLDQLSAILVHQLVSTKSAFVVMTARTGLVAPEPIVSLWKEEIVERMSVKAVSPSAVETLLREVLGGPVAGGTVAQFAERSEGNLLFLREQIEAAVEEGRLTKDAGVWRMPEDAGPQPRLIELVELRLTGLAPHGRQCLEVIAFGEPLELLDAVAIVGEDAIAELDESSLLSVRPDGWGGGKVWLAHPLFGEVLRAQTSLIRARQITRELAVTAEERKPTQIDEMLRIAAWRLVCGGGTPEFMERAATFAFARHDYDLATRLARAALVIGAGPTTRVLLAEALGMTGKRREAEQDLAALATTVDDPDLAARIAHARMVNAHLNGDTALGLRVYRDAEATITDPRRRDELTLRLGWVSLLHEGPRGALRSVEKLWSTELEGSLLVAACLVQGPSLARSGRTSEALEVAARGRAAQDNLTEPFDLHHLAHQVFACEALATAGRFEELGRHAQSCYDQAIAAHSASMQMQFSLQRAKANLNFGRVVTAGQLAGEAVGIAHQINDTNLLGGSLTTLAEALAYQGETDAAARAMAEWESRPMPPWGLFEPGIARAWIATARGDLRTARRELEDEAERSLAFDDLQLASRALHDLVRIGYPEAAREALATLATRVEGELVATQARHAAAAVARDGRLLGKVGADFRAMGAMLLAAEAYSDAAVALRTEGDPKRAATFAHTAGTLLTECEGASTPAVQPLNVRAQLTPAERSTAMLAAQGWSNKDIAATEHVSVRTVESRLQVAYSKLGISSRKELAEHLAGQIADL